ncbi:hypothetical protein ANN_12095 [Periplaneta americana]|uniref:Uncharacterized protein n=1 Tax=Periplaneta americana TaxID=6978 RepID=A0ABQ8T6W0_PERAM|nr:hypothetical protein ANN_12095 [Periplaneta americana]
MRTTKRWRGRRGSAAEFPPLSPDLTPPDVYLWGALKDTVYATKPQTLEELRVQIEHACNDIPLATVQLFDGQSGVAFVNPMLIGEPSFLGSADHCAEASALFADTTDTVSRAVASRSKASCLGLALRNARWSSPRGRRNFLMNFGQCMGPVPTQHRDALGELR